MEIIPINYSRSYYPLYRLNTEERFIALAIMWGVISSCIILLLVKIGITTSSVFALKDMPLYLGSFFLANKLFKYPGARLSGILILFFLLYLFLNYALLNPLYNAPLNNIRQMLAPLVVLFIFSHLTITAGGAARIMRFLSWIIVLVFVFGIVEQAFALWRNYDLSTYFRLKGIPTDESGMSFMFYEPMLGYRERMTSTFLDPVSAGHFFASAGILLFYLDNKTRFQKMAFMCCLAGLVLALSKGAMLQFGIGIIILNGRVNWFIRFLFVSLPFITLSQLAGIKGFVIHSSGFLNSMDTLTLFGHGIGTVGNYAKMFSEDLTLYYALGISDTYIGALLGQIGIVGTLAWICIGVLVLANTGKSKKDLAIACRILLSILAVSILSENTLNVTSFVLPAIIAGISLQLANRHREFSQSLTENLKAN